MLHTCCISCSARAEAYTYQGERDIHYITGRMISDELFRATLPAVLDRHSDSPPYLIRVLYVQKSFVSSLQRVTRTVYP